jgi:hypothetical protein
MSRWELPLRKGKRMQLVSGKSYWPADPRAEEVDITDIAHALGMVCRFGGQCLRFYSVAEHSVHVSMLVPPEHALQALLHDAPEAYIGDMIRPVKDIIGWRYHELESLNWAAVASRFNVPYAMHPSVKEADDAMLQAERRLLKPQDIHEWEHVMGVQAAGGVTIAFLNPEDAKDAFLYRFHELVLERDNGCPND